MLQVYWTKDESPTLIVVKTGDDGVPYQEKMHHSDGAWTETLYIYYPALKQAAEMGPLKVLSLGLGLGYNEVMACAHEMTHPHEAPVVIHSFELLEELKEDFSNFVRQGRSQLYSECYQKLFQLIAKEFKVDPEALRARVQMKIEDQSLLLLGPYPQSLPQSATPQNQYNCLLYDAFSNKMSPELWTEDFLKKSLGEICQPKCILSTYAATGALKRSLISLGFEKVIRPGFSGKRDSSFYVRNS